MVKNSTNGTAHEDVGELYRRAAKEFPPAHVDAAILRAARSAVTPRTMARSPFSSAWAVPASLAAVLVLSVALVVPMSREHAVPVPDPLPSSTGTTAMETSPRDEMPTPAYLPEPAPSKALQDAAPAKRDVERVGPGNRKASPPQSAAAPSHAGDGVFETLKPFGRTMPNGNAPVSAVSPPSAYPELISAETKGEVRAYSFIVKIGGGRTDGPYIDRWEVLSEDGRLLYRGVPAPDDIKEQTAAISGGPVAIDSDATVWILAHTSAGYRPTGLKGSPRSGFRKTQMPAEFAAKVVQLHGG